MYNKELVFNSWKFSMPKSKGNKSSLLHWESKKRGKLWGLWKQIGKLFPSYKPLAAGILESVLEGNKPLIKIQYLQWPLSNSRCRHGDFSTDNQKRGCYKKWQFKTGSHEARIAWDTEKAQRKWNNTARIQILDQT